MGNLGFPEMVVILAVVVLLFGANKIPQLMRGMGQGISEFKKGLKEGMPEEQAPNAPSSDKNANQAK